MLNTDRQQLTAGRGANQCRKIRGPVGPTGTTQPAVSDRGAPVDASSSFGDRRFVPRTSWISEPPV